MEKINFKIGTKVSLKTIKKTNKDYKGFCMKQYKGMKGKIIEIQKDFVWLLGNKGIGSIIILFKNGIEDSFHPRLVKKIK